MYILIYLTVNRYSIDVRCIGSCRRRPRYRCEIFCCTAVTSKWTRAATSSSTTSHRSAPPRWPSTRSCTCCCMLNFSSCQALFSSMRMAFLASSAASCPSITETDAVIEAAMAEMATSLSPSSLSSSLSSSFSSSSSSRLRFPS